MLHSSALEHGRWRSACLHEVLEVVVVVEGLLGLVADSEDGLHRLHRVLPPQRLRAQQDAVHAVQHRIRHVCGLGTARDTHWSCAVQCAERT